MNQEYVEKFSKTLSKRFTKRQKEVYAEALNEVMEPLGYKQEIDVKKKSFTKTRNIIFGNLKMAKSVIVVPYDTPSRIFWPKFSYYPLDGTKSSNKSILPLYGPVLVIYALVLAILYLTPALKLNPYVMLFLEIVLFGMFILLFLFLIIGLPNKNNANRNSAAVIAALEIASKLNKDQRKSTAFIFTDRNANRHYGAQRVSEKLDEMNKHPNLIFLNCIGKGKEMIVGYTSGNRKLAQEMLKKYKGNKKLEHKAIDDNMRFQSPLAYAKRAIIISAGEYDDKGNLVLHEVNKASDKIIEEENVDTVVEVLSKYIASSL